MAIAFIDLEAHPTAGPYYQRFPDEPIRPHKFLTVNSIVQLNKMTVFSLLQAILKSKAQLQNGQILIVSHGVAEGLDLNLIPSKRKEKVKLQLNALELLLENMRDNKRADYSDEVIAQRLFMSKDEFVKFKNLMTAIQSLQFTRVEFRACNVGANKKSLEALRAFFGARVAGAPKVLDSFGLLTRPKSLSPTNFVEWLKEHPNLIIKGAVGSRFAYKRNITEFIWNAESESAVIKWIANHFPPAKNDTTLSNKIYIHSLLLSNNKDVFPGDKEYRSYLESTD